MANICDFTIIAKGAELSLVAIKDFLRPRITYVGGSDDEFVLELHEKRLGDNIDTKLLPNAGHVFVWLTEAYKDQTVKGDTLFKFEGGEMRFHGASKWDPPVGLVLELSKLFPTVEFEVWGTTEHECFEHYSVVAGEARELEFKIENPQLNDQPPNYGVEVWRIEGKDVPLDEYDALLRREDDSNEMLSEELKAICEGH